MIRLRALGSSVDRCSLPSPRRIPRSVAGMAFNFSRIKLPRATPRAGQAIPAKPQPLSVRRASTEAPLHDSPALATRAG